MSPARLREIADTLPGYVCGQLQALADAWERDLAAGREEAATMQRWVEEAAAAENANARDLRAALDERDEARKLLAEARPLCDAAGSDDLLPLDAMLGRQIDAHLAAHHDTPKAATSGDR